MVSLTERLHGKDDEEAGGGGAVEAQKKSEHIPGETTGMMGSLHFSVKVEDRLSTGSGGSAVVDEEGPVQLVDSGDSYFPTNQYHPGGPVGRLIHSEEDDASDDGRSYFSDVFAASQHQEEGEGLGWWVWS